MANHGAKAQVRYGYGGLVLGLLECVRFRLGERLGRGAGYPAHQALGIDRGLGSDLPLEPANRFSLA